MRGARGNCMSGTREWQPHFGSAFTTRKYYCETQ